MDTYEKKYNEALERARALWQEAIEKEYANDYIKDYETIFPELRESEDERARKAALKGIEYLEREIGWDVIDDIDILDVKDYLEKQKEQNREDEGHTDFTIYHPLKNGKGKYECIPYSFYGSLTSFSEDKDLIDFLRTCFYTKEECNEWIKQQKEQKPAEWSEKRIADIFEKVGLAKIVREQGNDALTNAVQSAMIELRKAENAEWLEEDEIYLQDALWCVEQATKVARDENDMGACWSAERWLKSLRPSWKPSEEQMKALNAMNCYGELSYQGQQQLLIDLYQQLKKLM